MSVKEDLVQAFHKAVDLEKRFGNRTDVPELYTNWEVVVDLIEKLCQRPTLHRPIKK